MSAVASQRCFNHLTREAVARCPECRHFYCRECITEHDDRVICATCLKKLAAAARETRRARWNLWPVAQIGAGLFIAWFIFYCAGLHLLALPAQFHDDKLWQATFFGGLESPGSDDE
ncbi:MAG TPA: rhomboid family protein [Chthoniobacteraceae bacterium]|nr:rhomboid family protein [Chthoniobacteraceae bacterium]